MSPSLSKPFVTVHALSAGYFTLPERFFVTPLEDLNARKTVPSLSFLIQHRTTPFSSPTRILFDLGLRRDIDAYSAPIRRHVATRKPITGHPDVVESLAAGDLTPSDIDFVIFSHVHWDHVGMPSDFASSQFVLGAGAAELLTGELKLKNGSHSFFESDLLPQKRCILLSDPMMPSTTPLSDDTISSAGWLEAGGVSSGIFQRSWVPKSVFPSTMDTFGDGSFYIVSAPGHLPGHLNLLCRLECGEYAYLAGDSCHDERLLTGEKAVATWVDEDVADTICCIHADKEAAERTLALIRTAGQGNTELGKVEIIFAHDSRWDEEARENGRFFPGSL